MTSRLGRLARNALGHLAFALALLFAPLAALAAPYAALVMDARTGEVLHAVNADARLHPASLTKMMTLYIAFEAIRRGEISLDSQVLISAHAASEPPSKLGLRAGQRVQLRYLIRAAAVKSANDAATAIAEAIEGSEEAFARRMNRTARALGMTNSQFRNAHGLTRAGHFSSARDMTILGRHLFYDYPDYYHIFSRRTADAGVAQVANTNSRFLDGYPGADGIKTGFTNAAGFNLTASAERGSKRIIATIFGGTSTAQRNAKMVELMDLGFARAPARARVAKPALPRYDRLPPEPAEPPQVAAAAAEGAADGSGRVAAGRILRVSGAVTRSPRPRPRPGLPSAETPPEALIAAIEGSVSAAIAEVTVTAAASPPPEPPEAAAVAEPAPPPRPRPEDQAAPDDAAPQLAALPDPATADADAVAAAIASAVAVAAAEPAAATAADGAPEAADAAPGARLAGVTPRPRPERPAAAAAPAAGTAEAVVVAEAAAAPEAEPAAPPPDTAVAEIPPDPVPAAAVAEAGVEAPTELAAAAPAVDAPAEAAAPAEPPVVVAAAAVAPQAVTDPVLRPEPEAPEVVARMSSSGGRHWGVAIGQYRARAEAERALITLALADMTGLGGALRRVNQRSGVWEASFMGLSAEQASLACRRMEARGMACRTLGP